MSLAGLLGTGHAETVAAARADLSGEDRQPLRALAYLITLPWTQANAAVIDQVGQHYEDRLQELAEMASVLDQM